MIFILFIDCFQMGIKLCMKSTSSFSKIKIDVETSLTRDCVFFFVLFFSFFSERSGIYIGFVGINLVFDKSHVAHKGFHDLPWPFQSQGFHECTKRISHRCERNVGRYDVVYMSVGQSDLCERTCETLWRSIYIRRGTVEQRDLCETAWKTTWGHVLDMGA